MSSGVSYVGGKRVATPEYRSWQMMKNRCLNPRAMDYQYYGGRGITVCATWAASFDAFLADTGERPTAKHTLDRVDSDGPYEKPTVGGPLVPNRPATGGTPRRGPGSSQRSSA